MVKDSDYENELLSLLDKVRNVKIDKIYNIQWSQPLFRSKKNQVFEIEKPDWVNFDKILEENDYIVDKDLLSITKSLDGYIHLKLPMSIIVKSLHSIFWMRLSIYLICS